MVSKIYLIETLLGIFSVLAGISAFSAIVCAIGWGACSRTEYCDKGFYLLVANRHAENEYNTCCPFPWADGYIDVRQCHSPYKSNCDYFENWKWAFIGCLLISGVSGALSGFLTCCIPKNQTDTLTQLEIRITPPSPKIQDKLEPLDLIEEIKENQQLDVELELQEIELRASTNMNRNVNSTTTNNYDDNNNNNNNNNSSMNLLDDSNITSG